MRIRNKDDSCRSETEVHIKMRKTAVDMGDSFTVFDHIGARRGDANQNGAATVYDALCVLQQVASLRFFKGVALIETGYNGDGEVTGIDALLILEQVVGLHS